MGCCCTCVIIALLILLVFIVKKFIASLRKAPPIPHVDENCWWGPGNAIPNDDVSVKPFKVDVSDKDLEDLKTRLANARPFTPPLENIQHEYGINTNLLTEIKDYWQNKYNWRERETYINKFPQFTTKIQGLNIHFLHVKPTETNGQKVVPLLLLHGWPGSALEFYEVIPKLTKPNPGRNFVFEVVVPNIPGFTFSEGAVRPGMNPTAVAAIFKQLMERLKFDKWYVQGGDWGSDIGTQMAVLYPSKVLGLHVNISFAQTPIIMFKRFLGKFWPSLVVGEKHRSKLYPLGNYFMYLMRETGYFHLHATRPDSVGVGLNDSPIGLAAYILEKFIVWTHDEYISRKDGGLNIKFNYDKLLDNISIYWFNSCITTSVRIYSESFAGTNKYRGIANIPVSGEVPVGYAHFANDFFYMPKTFLKEKYHNIVHYNELPTGGHFAAFEEPELMANDVWEAVEKFQNFHRK